MMIFFYKPLCLLFGNLCIKFSFPLRRKNALKSLLHPIVWDIRTDLAKFFPYILSNMCTAATTTATKKIGLKIKLFSLLRLSKLTSCFESVHHAKCPNKKTQTMCGVRMGGIRDGNHFSNMAARSTKPLDRA